MRLEEKIPLVNFDILKDLGDRSPNDSFISHTPKVYGGYLSKRKFFPMD
jgi:hypothetical protein